MTRPDAKFTALRNQGFTGSLPDMTLQWLQNGGAVAGTIPDAWMEMLAIHGITDTTISDGWYTLLGNMGYTGQNNDRQLAFWNDGGILPPVQP